MSKIDKKSNMPFLRTLFRTCSLFLCVSAFFISFLSFTKGSAASEVAIIKSKNIKPYNIAIKAFSKSVQARIAESDMESDLKKGAAIAKKIQTQNPDVIFSVGAEATYAASNNIRKIPIIFSMVTDPVRYNIQGENVTGVKLEIPMEKQIEILKEIMPDVRKIGAIYSDEKANLFLDKLKSQLSSAGIELVTRKISSPKDIPAAIKKIMSEVDSLWLVFDPIVTSSPRVVQEVILFQALRSKMPVIGFNKWSVTAGALFCLYSEYEDIGIQSGKMVNLILQGTSPSSIPIESPEKVKVFFNEKVIRRIESGITLNIPDNAYIWEGK